VVRTYWFVPVFNEASGNLGLQPDRTDNQIESNFGPVLCAPNGSRAAPKRRYLRSSPLRQKLVRAFAPGQLRPRWTWSRCAVVRSTLRSPWQAL
jgi:hypothetical protein